MNYFTMSEMLRKQYEKSFSQPFENAKVDDPQIFFDSSDDQSDPRFDNLVITHADVEDAIDSLSANASPGPDYFPAVLRFSSPSNQLLPQAQLFTFAG